MIVALRYIEPTPAGAWWVQWESNPSAEYYVAYLPELDCWTCNCKDAQQRGNPCKHALAVQVRQACEARDRGTEPPPIVLPFMELDPGAPIPFELTPAALAVAA